ncbi:N-ATPase, AtpR subunit [Tistlia consotensis]|uniref:N-ATPase, AtpR subunit n=1 Tax=Tistlia consotensis USBA 355 TaxID=560819 RepID=A0A1Y6CQA3_9PROT|nr:ATP synthase subunit I [Tistlia consotensis]SMF81291.1 N-ATPase, AtpR subunit [Tistlia consotensis USBA 355]SNS23003.1 N-ATPase, AtpR subunit [Tistlia consotensis]
MTQEQILAALPWLPLGGLVGWAFFASLRRVAELYLGGGGAGRALALQLGRLALAGVLFWLAARQGAAPLGALFLGFLLARLVIVRRDVKRLGAGS